MVERVSAGVLLAIAAIYLVLAWGLEYGSLASPGVGFVPRTFGVLFLMLTAANLVTALRRKPSVATQPPASGARIEEAVEETEELDAGTVAWWTVGLYLAVCVAYVVALPLVGYLPATAVALFALLKLARVKGWVIPLIITVAVTGGFYVIFQVLLKVQLP